MSVASLIRRSFIRWLYQSRICCCASAAAGTALAASSGEGAPLRAPVAGRAIGAHSAARHGRGIRAGPPPGRGGIVLARNRREQEDRAASRATLQAAPAPRNELRLRD